MGRTADGPNGEIRLITSAAQVEFQFSGDTCSVYLSTPVAPDNHQYAVLEVDGNYEGRFLVDSSVPVRIPVPVKESRDWHTVRVVKATEASNGVLDVHRATAAGFRKVPIERALKVEFIGNSITAAMGADTLNIPCGKGSKWYDQHNAYWSYAAIAGRQTNSEFMLTAVSGAGIYRNWNSDGPTVPELYNSSYLHADSTVQWPFQGWIPDVVTIALGTNDMSPGDGRGPRDPFDSATFVSTYIQFIKRISSNYPNAQIVLLTSPLKTGRAATTLYNCLQSLMQQSRQQKMTRIPVRLFEFREMKATGCTGHPLIPEQQVMGKQMTTLLEMLRSELLPDF